MPDVDRPKLRRAANSRGRGLITTLLLIGLAVMIVRDIFVRRFSSEPSAPDVIRRLP